MRNPYPLGTMDALEFDQEIGEQRMDAEVQREIDDAAEALRALEARRDAPKPQPCSFCDNVFAGAVCNICKEERPSYTALKAMSAKREAA